MHRSVILLVLFWSFVLRAQTWEQRTSHPDTAYVSFSFSIGERLFMGGGVSRTSPLPLLEYPGFHEYLPATDQWVSRSPIPTLRYGVTGFSLQGKGYVACGWHNGSQLNDVWQYDPVADHWTQRANFPGAPRYSCISVATSTKAYLGLGYSPWMNDWWEYDATTDTWTQRASFPNVGRQAACAFVINDKVYVGTGSRDVTNNSSTIYKDFYKYDPVTNTWSAIASMPGPPRMAPYAFSFGGLGYVFCGGGMNGSTKTFYSDGWAYDPVHDQWLSIGGFPGVPMNGGVTMVNSSAVYLGTGAVSLSSANWVPTALTRAFWKYTPAPFNGLSLRPKVFLEGCYNESASLMSDWLRLAGLLPSSEPYTGLGYAPNTAFGATMFGSALTTTDNNAIVDWVVVELRSSGSPSTVMASRSALLQRDGDVVDADGVSPVLISALSGNYYVAIRHRNHLGIMTASPFFLSTSTLSIDLTTAVTPTYGVAAQKQIGVKLAMWAGDATGNGTLAYTGSGNDRDPILVAVGGTSATNTLNNVYDRRDVNLDGAVKYTGVSNDRDPILVNIGGVVPTNTRTQQLP